MRWNGIGETSNAFNCELQKILSTCLGWFCPEGEHNLNRIFYGFCHSIKRKGGTQFNVRAVTYGCNRTIYQLSQNAVSLTTEVLNDCIVDEKLEVQCTGALFLVHWTAQESALVKKSTSEHLELPQKVLASWSWLCYQCMSLLANTRK